MDIETATDAYYAAIAANELMSQARREWADTENWTTQYTDAERFSRYSAMVDAELQAVRAWELYDTMKAEETAA